MKLAAYIAAAIIIATACWAPQPTWAADGAAQGFAQAPDGTVSIDGLSFPSLSAYYQSQYFQESGRRCGLGKRPPDLLGAPAHPLAAVDCSAAQTVIRSQYAPARVHVIAVAFHVIHKTDGTGNISDQQIADQIRVLNEDYRAMAGTMGSLGYDAMILFELKGVTRTANDDWFNDRNESTYKSTLGWDQTRYLNIYSNTASGYLGYAYLPWDHAGQTLDGVVIAWDVVGGRDQSGNAPYDQGRTATHEVGHYLGLLHTFENYGCANSYTEGDLIVDTNSENTDHYGCSQTSTCGTLDPIHNYMNYTDDDCMQEFTPEQVNRMICSLISYRPLVYRVANASPAVRVLLPTSRYEDQNQGGIALPWLHLLTGD